MKVLDESVSKLSVPCSSFSDSANFFSNFNKQFFSLYLLLFWKSLKRDIMMCLCMHTHMRTCLPVSLFSFLFQLRPSGFCFTDICCCCCWCNASQSLYFPFQLKRSLRQSKKCYNCRLQSWPGLFGQLI